MAGMPRREKTMKEKRGWINHTKRESKTSAQVFKPASRVQVLAVDSARRPTKEVKTVKTTETNGNSRNGIKGTRLSIWDDKDKLIDRFEVPVKYGHAREYCEDHPAGAYGKRYAKAIEGI